MWVPKSEAENEKEIRKEALSTAGLFSSFVFTLITLAVKLGYRKWRASFDPISWEELFTHLPWLILITLIFFICAYPIQKKNIRRSRSSTLVCLSCGEAIKNNNEASCRCGGRLVDLNHVKWRESEENEETDS